MEIKAYMDVEDILKLEKKIVFWGAGKSMESFISSEQGSQLAPLLEAIIDKNKEGYWELADRRLALKKPEILKQLSDRCILIITTIYAENVIQYLINQNIKVDTYYFESIVYARKNKKYYNDKLPLSLKRTTAIQIPKIIHYCWFGKGEKSELNKKCIATWKKHCPDYEIKEWNEENYDVTKNRYMHESYKAKKYGITADFFRFDTIYNYGGIYLDTDVEMIKNIDDLLYQDAFLGIDCSEFINTGIGFGSKPKNELFKRIMKFYEGICFIDKNSKYNLTPSPDLLLKVFEEHGFEVGKGYQRLETATVYPERVLSGYSFMEREYKITKDTYLAHKYEATWVESDTKDNIENYLMKRKKRVEKVNNQIDEYDATFLNG